MKCFLNTSRQRSRWLAVLIVTALAGWTVAARGALPSWIRNIEGGSAIDAAFFRAMPLPGGDVLLRRPPSETRTALGDLIKAQPGNAELYSLRALEDEQQLDFAAAEADWKKYAEESTPKARAQLALADFYHRRLRPLDEIKTLSVVAAMPPDAAENLTPVAEQDSWRAFERIFGIIQEQGLPAQVATEQYRAWLTRYPKEPSLYARFLEFLIAQKDYGSAMQLVAVYEKQFPQDEIFPVRAKATVEYRRGSLPQGLAVYEHTFQPLWAPDLVKSYFDLLAQTHGLRKFLDQAQAALSANPEDLNAMARIFYYYQQEGKLEAAQETVTAFRRHKEATHSEWTAQELYVCARLLQDIHVYPEAARYYFALYNSQGMDDGPERALAALTDLLLTAPESPVLLGAGNLSMYRDIATMDSGPGYLNGILSLILNTTAPSAKFYEEEQRAVPYFHRARAAALLALLDSKFPSSQRRPELHAKLLEFYASAAESDAVIRGGQQFLASFPAASQRTAVALLMADGYSRTGKTQEEFAIYDAALQELAARAQKVPLGESVAGGRKGPEYRLLPPEPAETESQSDASRGFLSAPAGGQAFDFSQPAAQSQIGARSPEYARVLERYLARLVQLGRIPQALAVLRGEIDRNPDDPGLYERLATFLQQNRLGTEQEEVYRRAMARFSDRSWYDKLARFYLRSRKNAEFEKLTQDVVQTFSGTELEAYFAGVGYGGTPALYLRLNLYANRRFPHNPVFVQNLLSAYHSQGTYDDAAWLALLRQHWFEESGLRNEFFEYLSRNRMLDSELGQLRPMLDQQNPDNAIRQNPAAGQFLAQAELWRSHFEQAAPALRVLADVYPADAETGRSASSVYRSLAYFAPQDTAVAAGIEDRLLQANPRSTEILARIGDIYADRDLLAKAGPYWDRIPLVTPGRPAGYLEAASIYWDYFDFEHALRLLDEGRSKLNDQNLYSYEAGAIYENERDYARAIHEYVLGALAGEQYSPAESRLLELARRPKLRDLVEPELSHVGTPPNPAMNAIQLRVRVLEAQNRKAEMEAYLASVVKGTTLIETAEAVETLATGKSLENVRQQALEKEAALTADPVNRLRLRYRLVQLYEGRRDMEAAQRNVEMLYRENPKILGVVRSTVDFYWRTRMYSQAITVLLQAAKDAYPDLAKQFSFEAARKSTEAKQYQQARELLARLLKDSPYDGEYLAAMADTYAKAGDDGGLRQFYLDRISAFRNAPLSPDERKMRIAALRRGLIPALTRMKDYAGAVDQYIELINNFPEDQTLVSDAALYAGRYQRQTQLMDFYARTVVQSPRDYRWPMVLAQMQGALEQYPAAIESYGKAITVRPDRVDLRLARAGLEKRLMRFDDAAADYGRAYELAYKDPKWMEEVAEIRARQGRRDEAVAALRTALIEGRTENSEKYFEVARRLESWGMLAQAQSFAEQGMDTAGADLLASGEHQSGAALYARIMTRLRHQEKAYDTLWKAMQSASSALPVIKEQVARQGIAGITDAEWRRRTQENRVRTARDGMRAALAEMGRAVFVYFTPEEKAAFSRFAESKRTGMDPADIEAFAVPLVQAAGLAELEARWRYELMMQPGAQSFILLGRMQPFVELQRRRLKFADLGRDLEKFAPRVEPMQSDSVLTTAAEAYRSAGDLTNETRVLAAIPSAYLGDAEQRLFQLLLARNPQELVKRAAAWSSWGQEAADYAVANGDASLAQSVVTARGRERSPVWSNAYRGLVGLYHAQATPDVNQAFISALGDKTIAERLATPADRAQQLAGNVWFYYGSRYGEYSALAQQGDPEDFLPAELELSPATASGYLQLADYYMERGDAGRAIAEYQHTLDLAAAKAEVYDRLALAYYRQGVKTQAVAQWKQLFTLLQQQVGGGRIAESFWSDFGRACDHLHARKLFAELRPEVDGLVRAYLRRNGNYRSNAVLRSVYVASEDSAAATQWMLELAPAAQDPTAVLVDIADASWIPLPHRAPIYRRVLQAREEAVLKAEGLARENAEQGLRSWQIRWIQYLIKSKQFAAAAEVIAGLPHETREAEPAALIPLELQLAAQMGTLEAKIDEYRANALAAPNSEILRAAARQLADAGDKQSALKLLEFAFARDLDDHNLVAANFLGLAEIRVAAGDTAGAVDLLRRLVLVVGNPFENLEPAAALLEKAGKNAEAAEFLEELVKSTPWEPTYRLRWAKAKLGAGQDVPGVASTVAGIASGPEVPYGVRTQAARTLAESHHPAATGSQELDVLAAGADTAASGTDRPFFYEARVAAAGKTSDTRVKIRLLSDALADTPARDDARIPLFSAAAAARADEMARSVIEPLLRQQFLRTVPPSALAGEDETTSSEAEEDEQAAQPGATGDAFKLPVTQQAQVAFTLAEVLVRLDRLNEALPYLQIAHRLEKTAARRQRVMNRIAEVGIRLRRQRLNLARQPILHEALEQDRVVRPRLVARAAAQARKPPKKGAQP